MSDSEGAIGKLLDDLMRLVMELDISGAAGYVSRVGRQIWVVKERVRAHMCHNLPSTLTTLGVSVCTLYCESRRTYQPSGKRIGGESTRKGFQVCLWALRTVFRS